MIAVIVADVTPLQILGLGLAFVALWGICTQLVTLGTRQIGAHLEGQARERARVKRQDELLAMRYLENLDVKRALEILGSGMARAEQANHKLTKLLAEQRHRAELAERELALRPPAHPIIRAIRDAGHPLTVGQLAQHLDVTDEQLRHQAEMLIAGGQLDSWVLRDGPAVDWAVIGYQLPDAQAAASTRELPAVERTLQLPAVRPRLNGQRRPILTGGW